MRRLQLSLAALGLVVAATLTGCTLDAEEPSVEGNRDPQVGVVYDNKGGTDYHVCRGPDMHWTWNAESRNSDHEIRPNDPECK